MRVTVKKEPEAQRKWEVRTGLVFDRGGELSLVRPSNMFSEYVRVVPIEYRNHGYSMRRVELAEQIAEEGVTPLGYLTELTLHVTDTPPGDG